MGDCWPLGILDHGKQGVLEDGDRVRISNVARNPNGDEKCVTTDLKPRDYFSASKGDGSPIDRLKQLVDAEPQIETLNSDFLRYVFNEQRAYNRLKKINPVRNSKVDEKIVSTNQKLRNYFSASKGNEPPIDRLKQLVDANPQLKTLNSNQVRYIFDEEREWMRQNVGH